MVVHMVGWLDGLVGFVVVVVGWMDVWLVGCSVCWMVVYNKSAHLTSYGNVYNEKHFNIQYNKPSP